MRVVVRLIFSVIAIVSLATRSPGFAAVLLVILLGGFFYAHLKSKRAAAARSAGPSPAGPIVLPGADPRVAGPR
jgi:hypothetical protein